MNKHTEGPWIYKRNEEKGDCDHIATVAWVEAFCVGRDCGDGHNRNYEHHGRAEDDARLIAAAPALLEALRAFLSVDEESVYDLATARAQARAVIFMATGSAE